MDNKSINVEAEFVWELQYVRRTSCISAEVVDTNFKNIIN